MHSGKRLFLLCIFCLAGHYPIFGQAKPGSNAYAIVVGIAKYQNPDMPALQFSDKDAVLFAAHLQSKPGGSVPIDNIKLLVNEDATIAAIYDALNWLKTRCTAGDKAYFYFSGHGDVETENKFSLGYLLAYNSPPNNYRNNAITIEHLNEVANHLSTKSKATVVLVTDACHSGKLAGDYYKGKQLVSSQLKLILNNEVRLAACAVDEKAAEGEDWGGGRGVFSYYLLKGLSGIADRDRNDTIQLRELNTYLDSAFAADKALIRNSLKQHPTLDGNPYQIMAVVNDSIASNDALDETDSKDHDRLKPGLSTSKPVVNRRPIDYFFDLMKYKSIESKLQFAAYAKIPRNKLPLKIVDDCIGLQQQLTKEKGSLSPAEEVIDRLYFFASIDTLLLLKNQLLSDKELVNNFIERFIQTVHNEAQDMVNAYLDGDIAEIEKRQYYSVGNRRYGDFVDMLRVALRIAPQDHYLYDLLVVQEAYISGLVARLEMVTAPDDASLLKKALQFQQKANKLEPYAAYIHNELGNLYLRNNKYVLAEAHYNTAKELSPTWAAPWSNQIRLSLATRNLKKATEAIKMADSLQPDLPYVLMNAGLVMATKGDLVNAESYFQKAIEKNNIHFLPYEQLGRLYTKTGDYDKADWFLAASIMRKKEFRINDKSFKYGAELGGAPLAYDFPRPDCNSIPVFEAPESLPYAAIANALPRMEVEPDSAFEELKILAEKQKVKHLLSHYMGKLLYIRKNWQSAVPLLLEAIRSFQPDSSLQVLLGVQLNLKTKGDSCLLTRLMHYQYDVLEDHYMLADIYERQRSVGKAIDEYQIITDIENTRQTDQAVFKGFVVKPGTSPEDFRTMLGEEKYGNPDSLIARFETPIRMGGYLKLADLYERAGDYLMVEKTLLQQVGQNREAGNMRGAQTKPGPFQLFSETNINFFWLAVNRLAEAKTFDFYQRILKLFPRDSDWQEKSGMFLHNRLLLSFNQIPVVKYKAAYLGIKKYAYPFLSNDVTGNLEDQQTERFALPGTGDSIVIATPKYDPLDVAIQCLNLSVKLSGDLKPKPQILEAIADLNSWMGNQKLAFETYKELIQNGEADVRLRKKIIDYCLAINELPFALSQLEILNQTGSATPDQKIQLVGLYAMGGATEKALAVLNNFTSNNLSEKEVSVMMYAKTNWLAGRNVQALGYLNKLAANLKSDQTDSSKKVICLRYYSIARLNALLKQNDKAFDALKKALVNGFAYGYVLNTDIAWNGLRASARWKTLNQQFSDQLNSINYDENAIEEPNMIEYSIPGFKIATY